MEINLDALIAKLKDKAKDPAVVEVLEALEFAEHALKRYEGKINLLIWKDSNGKKVCRHCGQAAPNHAAQCVAENILVLKNP